MGVRSGGVTEDINDDEPAQQVRNSKKAQIKQRRDIIMQFDKIATSFQSEKRSDVGKDAKVTRRDGSEVEETAGMIKKRNREKKKE